MTLFVLHTQNSSGFRHKWMYSISPHSACSKNVATNRKDLFDKAKWSIPGATITSTEYSQVIYIYLWHWLPAFADTPFALAYVLDM